MRVRILECEGAKAEYCRCCRRAKVLRGRKTRSNQYCFVAHSGGMQNETQVDCKRRIVKTDCKDGLIEKGLWAGLRETLQ